MKDKRILKSALNYLSNLPVKLNAKNIIIILSIAIITIFHYITPAPNPLFHGIYRRLYYLPIILGAVNYGLRGGIITSLIISIIYIPHIMEKWDKIPLQMFEAVFEIFLYNIVGYITGLLVEKQRKEQNEKERLFNRLKKLEKKSIIGEMASVITHELKTPLASISGAVEIIENEMTIPKNKKKIFDILNKELARINYLINKTFTLFKTERFNKIKVDLQSYIRELKTLYSLLPEKHIAVIKFSIKTKINNLYIDPDMFKGVFINLFNNAIQAIKNKGEIKLQVLNDNNYLYFSIKDNGHGIKSSEIKDIFNPFYSTKQKGLGLGLAIVKRIVELHNGKIECISRIDKGTKFIIKLPLEEVT